ncbi:MAG: peptidylprolyl isomerase [Acidobacteriota bacterium]|jgi:peptidyl-prolyl cis-trans isomerase A (cyclophilin A)|nr:peptidylprolyl isomerase [Acidobacteriota bacterium]
MRFTVISLIFAVLFAAFIAGCSRKPSEQPAPPEIEAPVPPEETEAPPEAQPQEAAAVSAPAPTAAETARAKLLNPAQLNEKAPETFRARFTTSKGDFVIEINRAWSPNGADRFYNLVKNGYYNNCRFFRVIDNFMVQFGIHGDPALNQVLSKARFADDPVKESNKRGYVTFAMTGQPNSRTTQIFVNYKDNSFLDADGFAPFGRVIEGMNIVDSFFSEYQGVPSDNQPRIQAQGNAYLNKEFPKLDYIKSASIM